MKLSESNKKAMIGAAITLAVVLVGLAIWKLVEPKVDNVIANSAVKVKAMTDPVAESAPNESLAA